MNKEKLIWMIGGSIITIVIFILAQQFMFGTASAEQLTVEEAKNVVLSTYDGEVSDVKDEGDFYAVTVDLKQGTYIVVIDKFSGDVTDIKLIEKNQKITDENNDQENGENEKDEELDKDYEKDTKTPINKEQAEAIARNEIKGNITSNEYNEKDYSYNVKVENDDEIVTLTINALTEEVKVKDRYIKDKPTLLSRQEAINIALSQVKGEVDDVDMKTINDTVYYLIEIETNRGQEAIVQVNGITGKTTIIWEEYDNDDDDDDDDDDD